MDKKVGPNNNKYKDLEESIKKSEEKLANEETDEEQDLEDNSEDLEEEIKHNENLAKAQFRNRLVKTTGLIILIIIIILLIVFLSSLISKKDYSYADVENIMKEAAQTYFADNKSNLPSQVAKKVKITDTVLVESKYMKPLNEYVKNDSCTGEVIVQKIDSKNYSYTAYLNCGDLYKTTELYKKVTDSKNIVTEGYGLYKLNDGYVYRGKEVNNYVKFKNSDAMWRILKVSSADEVTLVLDDVSKNSFTWDERYNSLTEDNSGINTYQNSTISEFIDQIYNNKLGDDSEDKYTSYSVEQFSFSKEIKSKLVKFKSCVGNRSETDTSRNGSTECSEVIETKIALLPVYDYLNASLDSNCKTTVDPSCQNYNFLANSGNFWLANGTAENSARVYAVNSNGYINKYYANNVKRIKLIIRVGTDTMIEKGNGTQKNPYIIR